MTNHIAIGNSTNHVDNKKAYEINETGSSVAKQANMDLRAVICLADIFILLLIGYKRQKMKGK